MGSVSNYMRRLYKEDPHLHAILSKKGREAAAQKRKEERERLEELRAFAKRHPPSNSTLKAPGPLTEKQVRAERAKMDEQANINICPID